jgi:hypothetical protein
MHRLLAHENNVRAAQGKYAIGKEISPAKPIRPIASSFLKSSRRVPLNAGACAPSHDYGTIRKVVSRGTDGSNPASSSAESATNQSPGELDRWAKLILEVRD